MRVTQVTYERLSKQRVDSYENERASCTVEVEEGECVETAMDAAKYEVEKALGLLPSKDEIRNAARVLKRAKRKRTKPCCDSDTIANQMFDDEMDYFEP